MMDGERGAVAATHSEVLIAEAPFGGGEMYRRIVEADWSASLGPIQSWPQSLRTAVDICLGSALPTLVWWGPNHVQLYNDASVAVLGARHPASLGQPARVAWADVWSEIGPSVDRVSRTGSPVTRRGPFVHANGVRIPVPFDLCFGAIRSESGGIAGILVTGIPSTALVATDQEARERANRLEHVLTAVRRLQEVSTSVSLDAEPLYEEIINVAVAIMSSDFASIQMLRPETGELELLGHRGFTPEAAAFWATVRADSRASCGQALAAGQRVIVADVDDCADVAGTDDLEMYHKTGIRSVQSTPLVARDGRLLGMISTHWRVPRLPRDQDLPLFDVLARQAADLIEQRRAYGALQAALDDQMRARAEAEDANQTKASFLATMSHELRTPLNAIIGFTELLDTEIVGPLTSGQHEQVKRIGISARHLLTLIQEVLTFSRLEAGREELRVESVDLVRLVESTVGLVEPLAAAKGLRLHFDALDVPHFETDPDRLRQILLNLLSNAIKFTDSGEIAVTIDLDETTIRIHVRDTGIGIAPEHRDRVFEAFTQVEQARSRRYGGTGLGLSVTRQLARLLAGEIELQSKVGIGSTFTVRLPR